jgi:hypothetical protein
MREVTPRLIVWLGVCFAALAIPLAGLPLWARQREVQPYSLAILLIAMTLALAFTGPWLTRTWTATLALVSASLPMLVIAAILSDQHLARGIIGASVISIIITVARLLSRFSGWSLLAPTIVLAPIAMGYLMRDFGGSVDVVKLSPLYWCAVLGMGPV